MKQIQQLLLFTARNGKFHLVGHYNRNIIISFINVNNFIKINNIGVVDSNKLIKILQYIFDFF